MRWGLGTGEFGNVYRRKCFVSGVGTWTGAGARRPRHSRQDAGATGCVGRMREGIGGESGTGVKIATLSHKTRPGWDTLEDHLGSASWFGDEFYLLQVRYVG
jgi:hypothetical protein